MSSTDKYYDEYDAFTMLFTNTNITHVIEKFTQYVSPYSLRFNRNPFINYPLYASVKISYLEETNKMN